MTMTAEDAGLPGDVGRCRSSLKQRRVPSAAENRGTVAVVGTPDVE